MRGRSEVPPRANPWWPLSPRLPAAAPSPGPGTRAGRGRGSATRLGSRNSLAFSSLKSIQKRLDRRGIGPVVDRTQQLPAGWVFDRSNSDFVPARRSGCGRSAPGARSSTVWLRSPFGPGDRLAEPLDVEPDDVVLVAAHRVDLVRLAGDGLAEPERLRAARCSSNGVTVMVIEGASRPYAAQVASGRCRRRTRRRLGDAQGRSARRRAPRPCRCRPGP